MEPGKGLRAGEDGRVQTGQDDVGIVAVQEQVTVGVEAVQTGALRVRRIQHQEEVDVPLTWRSEQAVVKRVAVNRQVDAEIGPRQEGDTLIVPVFAYVPVTEIRLMLKEEIYIQKHVKEETTVQTVQCRRADLIVQRRKRVAGASVVLVSGEAALYLDRGGKRLVTFPAAEDPVVMVQAARALTSVAARKRGKQLRIETIDGDPARTSVHAPRLYEADFASDVRGLTLEVR